LATRKDVAELAGVSPAVVTYVLNKSNYVSKETREKVLAAIKQLNYQPNYLALSLKTNRTYNFALVCDDIRSELFSDIAYHMEQQAYEHGYNVFLCSSHEDDKFLRMLMHRKMDGIFIATSIYKSEQLNYLASGKMPVVLYKAREYHKLDDSIKCICVDYRGTARVLTNHLIERGYKQIAFLPPIYSALQQLKCDDYRYRGYCDSLISHNIPIDESLVCFDTQSYASILNFASGVYERKKTDTPIAFVAGNDYLATIVMNHFIQQGMLPLRDFAIVGMDATASSVNVSPRLTTMGFSKEEVAKCVVNSMLLDKEQVFDPQDVFFQTHFIPGGSS